MTLKTYAAYVTGALAMLVTAFILWCCTQLPIEDVIAAGLVVYCLVIFATLAVIDRLERRRRRKLAATIITLVQEEWKRGKEKTA